MKLHGTWSTLHQEPHLISPISPISLPTVSALRNVLRPRSKDGCAPSAQEQGTDPYPPSGVGNSCFAAAWCRCHVVGCSFALEPPFFFTQTVHDRRRRGARHEFTRQKKKRADCVRSNQLSVKKFPAPCYSPIVKFTVPSPLEALTTVFGKGTCVTPPPWAPENIPMKKSKSL